MFRALQPSTRIPGLLLWSGGGEVHNTADTEDNVVLTGTGDLLPVQEDSQPTNIDINTMEEQTNFMYTGELAIIGLENVCEDKMNISHVTSNSGRGSVSVISSGEQEEYVVQLTGGMDCFSQRDITQGKYLEQTMVVTGDSMCVDTENISRGVLWVRIAYKVRMRTLSPESNLYSSHCSVKYT